jgi:diguanylate cyclase (GGDEF)-like protein
MIDASCGNWISEGSIMPPALNIEMPTLGLSAGVIAGAAQKLLSDLDTSFFNGNQSELLREVLRFAASAEGEIVDRQARIERLEAGSITDDLTGLENERGLRTAVKRAMATGERYGTNHVLVLLAINGLDDIEDAFGRTIGQTTMQQLAGELRRCTRGSDVLARTGRHELAALLTPCPPEHAAAKAATLAAHLGALPITFQDRPLVIEVTAGCASFSSGTTFERISALAHQMLSRRWEPQFKARPAQKPSFGRRGPVAPVIDTD